MVLKEYLANINFVKTQSFGPQWEPHQLTMNCFYMSMNVSIYILFVAHPRHNMLQLLG